MKNRELTINILIGLSLISIPILTSPDLNSNNSLFQIDGFKRSFLGYLLLLAFFYFHYYVIIPKIYARKKWWLYGLLLLLCFGIIWIIPTSVFPENLIPRAQVDFRELPAPLEKSLDQKKRSQGLNLFRIRDSFLFQFLMVVILSLLLKLNDRLKAIKNEKLRAEVSYLKAQINPHFLFNTLNSIYALTLIKSDKAPNAILKLSDMMRYVVTESDSEKVPLQKEIQYISDYIDLQKLRIGDQVDLIFKVNGACQSKRIVPIILINYIENAFKYGVNPDIPSKILILIDIDGKGMRMKVENDIVVNHALAENYTGEGLKNTNQRLDFYYASKYDLSVSKANGIYKTNLFIDLV